MMLVAWMNSVWINDPVGWPENFSLLKNLKESNIHYGPLLFNSLVCVLLQQKIMRCYLLSEFYGYLERVWRDGRSGGCNCSPESVLTASSTQIWPLVLITELYTGHNKPVSFLLTAPAIVICKSARLHVHHILSNVLLATVAYDNGSRKCFSSTASTVTTVPFRP